MREIKNILKGYYKYKEESNDSLIAWMIDEEKESEKLNDYIQKRFIKKFGQDSTMCYSRYTIHKNNIIKVWYENTDEYKVDSEYHFIIEIQ